MTNKRLPLRVLLYLGLYISMLPTLVHAADIIKIDDIDFRNTFQEAENDWLQMEIQLTAGQNTLPEAFDKDFLTNVKVTATLAYRNPKRDPKQPFIFFESDLTIAVLETGKKRTIYFYMPGDIIKLYKLKNRPFGAYLGFEIEGKKLKPQVDFLYGSLKPKQLKKFQAMASGFVKKTAGMFRPITRTPHYVLDKIDLKELPAFVRKKDES